MGLYRSLFVHMKRKAFLGVLIDVCASYLFL